MSHTPQKFVTVPLLVEAVQYDGTAKSIAAINAIFNKDGFVFTKQDAGWLFCGADYVQHGEWLVRLPVIGYRILQTDEFQAQYTPFKEELKDSVEIINP